MATSFDSVAKLSEQELLDHFAGLVVRDRRTTAKLLVVIAEIDERKLWAAHACSSMFTFCMKRFHMSEQVAAKRIWAARTARRFPVILEMVARGGLHLTAIHLLAKHLTEHNHIQVLERAKHKSSREVERLVAELAPRADVESRIRALPGLRGAGSAVDMAKGSGAVLKRDSNAGTSSAGTSRDEGRGGETSRDEASSEEALTNSDPAGSAGNRRDPLDDSPAGDAGNSRIPDSRTAAKPIVALSPRRYKIEITVDQATHDKLRSLQDLLARSGTGRDPAAIISRAIDVLLDRTLARKAGCTDRPRSTTRATPATQAIGRSIPAAVRREVWRRDSGRCCYSDGRGRRCDETSNVELHHKTPYALGGPPTPANIELRCAAHNQFQADMDFGRSFMDARRRHVAA